MEDNESLLENDSNPLSQEVQQVNAEIRKIKNEFNSQRAKMKELYIQKDTEYAVSIAERKKLQQELDELKSQFVVSNLKSENEMHLNDLKAQEEISSLQQLVQDTIDESTLCKAELERFKEESNRLLCENRELQGIVYQQQEIASTGLAPQMLSQVKRTLVRKLGGDSGNNTQQENINETLRRKVAYNKYANEDAEVLRSIVEQLQEEMKALKEKLREADEKLQIKDNSDGIFTIECQQQQVDSISEAKWGDSNKTACQLCKESKRQQEELLSSKRDLQSQIGTLQNVIKKSHENLQKEASLRKDLEHQWQEKREKHKLEVQQLRDHVKTNEQHFLNMQQKFLEIKDEVMRQLQRATDKREQVKKHLELLQADNNFLSGRYLATSEELENQRINLPNNVVELQELILHQQNELIRARLSSEFEKQKCVTSVDEINILRSKLEECNNERKAYKKRVQVDIKSLQDRLTENLVTVQNYEMTKALLERKEVELNRRLSQIHLENIELQDANEKLCKLNADYKLKVKILQDDLTTSEQVQKDFVKLSQTLQMSLEKLRHADSEVRWQEDDDVENCPTCSAFFTVTVRRIHCRHCGHIYCEKCLTKTVTSGPRKKVAKVCDMCHTLLTPNTAPYFSHESSKTK